MRRLFLFAACAAGAACAALVTGCVSVNGPPDPHGALGPRQRLVVDVYPAPGPWIVAAADSKAEAATKITPLGFLLQAGDDSRTLSVSKNLQQYLPRPRLGAAVQESLLNGIKVVRSSAPVVTGPEAGITNRQLAEWNKSKDQLDWRQRYYSPDPDSPAPRDYASILTLDDALILDVNVSFGADANASGGTAPAAPGAPQAGAPAAAPGASGPDDGRIPPVLSATARVYRGDTSHLLWEREISEVDSASSATLTDYLQTPSILTDSLQKLAPKLGADVANAFLDAFALKPSTSAPAHHVVAPLTGGGLVPMSAFDNLSSPAPAAGPAPATNAPAAIPAAASGIAVSTATVAAPAPAEAAPVAPPPAAAPPTASSAPPISPPH
ncbi:MAG: hypothetical protein ACHQ49_05070 [Elusimicrobiota bacterium]